jgi:hypothetical protein
LVDPAPVLETGASDGENPMLENVDVFVCEPEVGINPQREVVFIQFEVMNVETRQGNGKSHTVLMAVPDAMQLLQTLSHIQKQFSLAEEAKDVAVIEIPQNNS